MAYKQNGRVASFIAVNNGAVEGCAANVQFHTKSDGAGFVFENQGAIKNSVSVRCVKGKRGKGFYYRNTGNISACAYLAGENAKKTDKDGQVQYTAGNPELYLPCATEPEQIYRQIGLDGVWETADSAEGFSLEPNCQSNHVTLFSDDSQVIPIETPEDLKRMIDAINAGDKDAAAASYRLTADLHMKGATLAPIGLSESHPFTGTFDGNGKTISNFSINCKGREFGGFFGYTKEARVANLTVDYILKGSGGVIVGGMAGCVSGGLFVNCHVHAGMTWGLCAGGFAGKNTGTIKNCYVCGKLASPIPLLPFIIGGAAIVLGVLIAIIVILVSKWKGKDDFRPAVIDPNQTPVMDTGKVDPPPAGTSRISLELNQDVYVKASTMVGQMDYVNPRRSTHDVVLRICISDEQLKKAGYDPVQVGVRTAQEIADEAYDPASSYTELYRSGRLQIGYKLSYCKLSALPNGTFLKPGDYDMAVMIDAYDPETNEKAIVNAQATTTIHILDQ